jgi:hypothetical protein
MVLSDKLLEKISTEGVNDIASTERWIEKLEDCLKELPEPNRDLIKQAYTPKPIHQGDGCRAGNHPRCPLSKTTAHSQSTRQVHGHPPPLP